MKRFQITLIALLGLYLFSNGQPAQNQINWNNRPHKGFVFEIDNDEAQKLLTKWNYRDSIASLLHTQVDTFDVRNGWVNKPEKGHFILVSIVSNKLHCEYTCVFPYQVFLFKEYGALSIQVLDHDGNVRNDAIVKLKRKRIRADYESKTYRIENAYFRGDNRLATVELDGFRSVFNVTKHKVPDWESNYNYDDGPDFYSYLITDKNKYKPNESVRLKSYALNGNQWPLRKELEVWMPNPKRYAKICTIEPHRPGSYAGEFKLHDSLKLKLDRSYSIQLRNKQGRVVASCRFHYEDYELFGNEVEIKLAHQQHYCDENNTLSIKATNENGLLLKDAYAWVTVKALQIEQSYQPVVSLKDTLIHKKIKLDPSTPTEFEIPSSLFQHTNTSYKVHVAVLNSDNERLDRFTSATHYFSNYQLIPHFSNDSICFNLLENGIAMEGVRCTIRSDLSQDKKEITLPYKTKINTALKYYTLENEYANEQITLKHIPLELGIEGGIKNDSFHIELINKQQLDISWYIYQGATLLHKGFDTALSYKSIIEDRSKNYYVELHYTMGGHEQMLRRHFTFRESDLNIDFDIPEKVFPGQTIDATITVTNSEGRPVKGVDLTALATTSKLNYYLPNLPYYGDISSPRPKSAHYSQRNISEKVITIDLNFDKWAKKAGLDTMKYYQLTYPKSKGFKYAYSINDSTQFAPYVMHNGQAQKIFVIELNRKPVYYSWTDTPNQYSFYISPDKKHEIALRLSDRLLILDSLQFEKGAKTILSFDLDSLPPYTREFELNPSFSIQEKKRHYGFVSQFNASPYKYGYLMLGKEFIPLFNQKHTIYRYGKITAGPIPGSQAKYVLDGKYEIDYRHEGNYSYAFEKNVVYKLTPPELLPKYLTKKGYDPLENINHYAANRKEFTKRNQYSASRKHVNLSRHIEIKKPAYSIKLSLPYDEHESGLAAILLQNIHTGITKAYYYGNKYYHAIPPELTPNNPCNIIALYNNGMYYQADSLEISPYSKTVINFNHATLHKTDSASENWIRKHMWEQTFYTEEVTSYQPEKKKEKIPYWYSRTDGNITGRVYDADSEEPLPGVCIVIKGTTTGTIADIDGYFSIDIPDYSADLVVSFIGYLNEEVNVTVGSDIEVYLEADLVALEEVIVIGYGIQGRSLCTGSVSSISGHKITPLEDNFKDEDENAIDKVAETELYNQLLQLNTIRSNFSDVGFWEPRLYTDRNGKSSFDITFPDDITRWDATVYAMNKRLQTGTARKQIKSYKPLMAELKVPRFLVVGDTAFAVGKVLNFTSDSVITGNTKWTTDTSEANNVIQFKDAFIEKLPLTTLNADSLKSEYSFSRTDGYFDGERRVIPVIEQGTVRANGTLEMLHESTSKTITVPENKEVTITLMDNQLEVIRTEITGLLNYRFACNEQLASKLAGLISHKILCQADGISFKYDKHVNNIIERLLKNQNDKHLWGWWNRTPYTSYWMSAHILRSLKYANDNGYDVPLNLSQIEYDMAYTFDNAKTFSTNQAELLHAMAMWNARLDYKSYVNKFDTLLHKNLSKNSNYYYRSGLYEKLLLQEVRQLAGISIQYDTILKYKKESMLGAVYFSDDKNDYWWYRNKLNTNLIAYRIAKRDSILQELTPLMQLYFIDNRQNSFWNTYQSANVITTILPDLIEQGFGSDDKSVIRLSGSVNASIDSFPYNLVLKANDSLTISAQPGLPMYYMQYTKERVTEAKTGVDGFEIVSKFSNGSNQLNAGEIVSLEVEVKVTKDANCNHVMLDIPIPASCSYASKEQGNSRQDSYREYHKERTYIFFENLSKGTHVFKIRLLPRFTGIYSLNPAQVSLMYIPVINANTALKKVLVYDVE